MSALLQHIRLGLVLALRNPMALVYGYVFPLIFLVSFLAIYRHDDQPLVLHLGALLTVTILGSACFGLPTTLVSERERGVWQRYRLMPAPLWLLVAGTLTTRYLLLLSAVAIQLMVAFAVGMPGPAHPLQLFLGISMVAFAFLGLGLLIAQLADTVPAVQALGQCIFLPMLMVGGIAVPLVSLPAWALAASAFFPGRYAVKVIQDCVTGPGLAGGLFDLAALAAVGAGALAAGLALFRWSANARFRRLSNKGWLALALGAWLAVGLVAQRGGHAGAPMVAEEREPSLRDFVQPVATHRREAAPRPQESQQQSGPAASTIPAPAIEVPAPALAPAPGVPAPAVALSGWKAVQPGAYAEIAFERLPPDTGLVSPIAPLDAEPDPVVAEQLAQVRSGLPGWGPGRVADPVQRVRNVLLIAAVPDVLKMEGIERHLPRLVQDHLRRTIPADDLAKLLYWVAMHPDEGDTDAAYELDGLGLPDVSGPTRAARARVMLYALKLLGREIGEIKP